MKRLLSIALLAATLNAQTPDLPDLAKGWAYQGPSLAPRSVHDGQHLRAAYDGNGALEAFYSQGDTRELSRAWSCGLLEASKIMMEEVSSAPAAKAQLAVINSQWLKNGCEALRARIKNTDYRRTPEPLPGVDIDVQSRMPMTCKVGQWYYATDTDQVFECVKPGPIWKYARKGEAPKR